MSFILDALKKSERERRTATGDTGFSPLGTGSRRRWTRWRPGLLGGTTAIALAVVAAVVLWWQPASELPPSREPRQVTGQLATPGASPASTESAETVPVIPAPARPELPAGGPVATVPGEAREAPERAGPVAAPQAEAPVAEAVTAPEPRPPSAVAMEPVAGGPLPFSRLPYDVRQATGPLRLDAHVFDREPRRRFVMINGKMLTEGEEVKPGLKLEEISSEGAVLNWQGERFLLAPGQ